jgi:hypothetical protein
MPMSTIADVSEPPPDRQFVLTVVRTTNVATDVLDGLRQVGLVGQEPSFRRAIDLRFLAPEGVSFGRAVADAVDAVQRLHPSVKLDGVLDAWGESASTNPFVRRMNDVLGLQIGLHRCTPEEQEIVRSYLRDLVG